MKPMSPRSLPALAALLIATLAVGVLLAQDRFRDPEQRSVYVSNLENPHPIEGRVGIKGTVHHSKFERFPDLTISPAQRHETTQFTEVGTLETDGFTGMTLSVHAQIKDNVFTDGEIGVVLLPEEDSIVRSFQFDGEIHLSLEAKAPAAMSEGSYASGSEANLRVGFPQYRVLLYNTTGRAAAVNVWAYLTN